MYAPGPESIDLMVPDSNAHFRDMMNSKSSDETKETNWPSVTGTFTKPKKNKGMGEGRYISFARIKMEPTTSHTTAYP